MMITLATLIGAAVGSTIGVVTATKNEREEVSKDLIIEDLSERYNELIDSINNGTINLEQLEDVDVEEGDEDGVDLEIRLNEEPEEDNSIPEFEFYPQRFVELCQGTQNRVQNLYTDIENCNDGEITFDEDFLLEEINADIAMICTAYQLRYVNGLTLYRDLLSESLKEITKIPNYDSSVKKNKSDLKKDIKEVMSMAEKLRDEIQLNNEKELQEAEEEAKDAESDTDVFSVSNDTLTFVASESDDDTSFVVPVYHKKGAI